MLPVRRARSSKEKQNCLLAQNTINPSAVVSVVYAYRYVAALPDDRRRHHRCLAVCCRRRVLPTFMFLFVVYYVVAAAQFGRPSHDHLEDRFQLF